MSPSQAEMPPPIVAPDFLAFSPAAITVNRVSPYNSRSQSLVVDEHRPLLGSSHRPRKTAFYRAQPFWLIPFAVLVAISKGMTLTPRIQVYTQLACNAVHYNRFHHTSTMQPLILPPTSGSRPNRVYTPAPHLNATVSMLDLPIATFSDCLRDPLVQKQSAHLQTAMTVITGILSAFTFTWWKHFGERYGRTTLLAIAALGWLLTDLSFGLASMLGVSWFPYGQHILFVAPIFEGAFGGWATLQSATVAYISDCTQSGSQSKNLYSFTVIFYLGLSFGPIIGGWLIRAPFLPFKSVSGIDVTHIFCISALAALASMFIALVTPESLSKESRSRAQQDYIPINPYSTDDITTRSKRYPLFRRIFDPLIVFWPRRIADGDGKFRTDRSLAFIACTTFVHFLAMGVFQLRYLYTEHIYGWSTEQLGYYASFTGGIRAVFLLFILSFIVASFRPSISPKLSTQPKLTSYLNRPSINGPHRPLSKLVISAPPPNKPFKPKPNAIECLNGQFTFDLRIIRILLLVDLLSQILVLAVPAPTYHIHALGDLDQQMSQNLFVLASSLSSFASGTIPAAQNLALTIFKTHAPNYGDLGPTNPADLFGAFALVQVLSSMVIGPLIFGMLYSVTVGEYPKGIFVAAAVLLYLSYMLAMLIRPRPIAPRPKLQRRQVSDDYIVRGRSRVKKDLRKDFSRSGTGGKHTSSSCY